MNGFWRCVPFVVSSLFVSVACADSDNPPAASAGAGNTGGGAGAGAGGGAGAGAGTSGDAGTAGGAGEGGSTSEYVDPSGRCRVAFAPGAFGCPSTYPEALASPNPCNTACAGPAAAQLLYLRDCTPTLRCAYDGRTEALVGAYFGDDVPAHCDDSYSVVAGDFPEQPTLNGYDLDLNCVPPAEASVSRTFNAHFGEPVPAGTACRSSHDQCRSAVRATVCINDRGTVAGDGACAHCRSNDDCSDEYPYASSEVRCEPSGLCSFGAPLVGACQGLGESCFTAESAYVCGAEGLCAPCETNEECSASGPYNLCLQGICMRSEPLP
jgi:hypothetical protein